VFVDFYPPNSSHSDFGAVGALPAPAGALSNGSGSSLSNLGSSFGSTGGNGSSSSRSSSVGSSGLTPSGPGNGGVSAAAAAGAGGGPVNGLGLCKLFCTYYIYSWNALHFLLVHRFNLRLGLPQTLINTSACSSTSGNTASRKAATFLLGCIVDNAGMIHNYCRTTSEAGIMAVGGKTNMQRSYWSVHKN